MISKMAPKKSRKRNQSRSLKRKRKEKESGNGRETKKIGRKVCKRR